MAENDDQWLWFDDDEPEQAPLRVDTGATDGKTAATSPEVVKAIQLHLSGKTDEALKELKRGIEIGKALVEIYPVLGQIYFELKKFEDAAAMFANMVVLDSRHKTGFYNQGVCLERCGKYKEAAEAFRTAIDIDGGRKEARLGYGICLLRLGDAEKALDQFGAYLRVDADHDAALFGRGVAALRSRCSAV
jgi:tetratricopeptide (TPR) repeat protein